MANASLISWSYGTQTNPTSAPYGSTIDLVPSLGHAPVDGPHIDLQIGHLRRRLRPLLQAVGLTGTEAYARQRTVPTGNVISLNPPSGTRRPTGRRSP